MSDSHGNGEWWRMAENRGKQRMSDSHGNGEWWRMAESRGKQCMSDSHGNGEWWRMAESRGKMMHELQSWKQRLVENGGEWRRIAEK